MYYRGSDIIHLPCVLISSSNRRVLWRGWPVLWETWEQWTTPPGTLASRLELVSSLLVLVSLETPNNKKCKYIPIFPFYCKLINSYYICIFMSCMVDKETRLDIPLGFRKTWSVETLVERTFRSYIHNYYTEVQIKIWPNLNSNG